MPGSRGSRASTRPSLHLRRGEEVDEKVEEEEEEVEEKVEEEKEGVEEEK